MNARRCFGLALAVLVDRHRRPLPGARRTDGRLDESDDRRPGPGRPDVRRDPRRSGAAAFGRRSRVALRRSRLRRSCWSCWSVGAVLPVTSGALHDARGDISAGQLARELVVDVVLLTAIPEEFAFRGVLLGSAVAQWGPLRGALVVSAAFGLWHVQPTLATMTSNPAVSGASAITGRALPRGARRRRGHLRRGPGVRLAPAAVAQPARAGARACRDERPRAGRRLAGRARLGAR